MDPKPHPNHQLYLRTLARLSPGQRMKKAFELSDLSKRAFRQGLRRRFPDLSEPDFHQMFLDRLATCHNSNY